LHFFLVSIFDPGSLEIMKSEIYVPNSLKSAGLQMRLALAKPLQELPKPNFVRAWCSIAYLFPGLHPEGFDDADSGWPRAAKRFAAEAWRRADAGELADDELYCCDAQWSGLFDRMFIHTAQETERRVQIAARFGEPGDV
jgi:hypothetical protein